MTQRPFFKDFILTIGLVFVYFIAGKIGNLFVIPPNYATVIFPPSGIALAGILLYGNRAGWGIFLGALCLNSFIAVNVNAVLISLGVAVGATLQAFVAAYLVQRFAAKPTFLSSTKNILLFLFCGGMVSALVNSTLSVSSLVAAGLMPEDTFFMNWLSWWGGDALGIMIFAPVILIWFSKENLAWQGKKWQITLPIVVVFILTVTAVFYEIKISNERIKMEFDERAKGLSHVMETSVTSHLNLLHTFSSFYASSTLVDRNDFHIFATEQLRDFQDIQAVGWSPIISATDRDIYEKIVQKEGYPTYQITERDENKSIVRANNRSEYVPIDFLEPYQGNEKSMGFDFNSNDSRREAFEKARDTDSVSVGTLIILFQDEVFKQKKGFIAFAPIYHPNLPHQTLEERRDAIASYVFVVFRASDMIINAFKHQNLSGLAYRLIDENAPENEQTLFVSYDYEHMPLDTIKSRDNLSLISRTSFDVGGGRMWQLEIVPTPDYFIEHSSKNVWLILLLGFILTLLTIIGMLMAAKRQYLIQMTNDELSQFKMGFDSLITSVIFIDNNREIIYANDSAIQLLKNTKPDFDITNVLGQSIDKIHKNPDGVISTLASLNGSVELKISAGDYVLTIAISPLVNQKGQRIGAIAEAQDITEKEKRTIELQDSLHDNEVLTRTMTHMQKVESIGRMTSGISHDFNNILACMLGYNEMNKYAAEDVSDKSLQAEIEGNTQQIQLAGQRAMDLIAKMMTYCRQDTQKEKMNVLPTKQIIEETLLMLQPALTSVIKLETFFESDATIQIDAGDLQQVLTNLAVNARDAMNEHGGIISFAVNHVVDVKAYCIACAAVIQGDFIELSVSDNGEGIEPKIIHRLFDPFFTTKPQGEGTGLGLSALSGIVHQSSGHILVESHQGEFNHGTRFNLLFPVLREN